MHLTAVAAVSDNGVIGDEDGEIPWPSMPVDREQYRAHVAGHPVILGRKTFVSMLEDLPGNHQIVLTNNPEAVSGRDTITPVSTPEEAIDTARSLVGTSVAFVLGGGSIYRELLASCDRVRISRIPGSYHGSIVFPPIDERKWQLTKVVPRANFTLEIWDRIRSPLSA